MPDGLSSGLQKDIARQIVALPVIDETTIQQELNRF